MTAPSKMLDQFVVRLPEGMRDRIKAAADASGRSMNAEIVATLEEKYPEPTDFEDRVRRLMTALMDHALRATSEAEFEGRLEGLAKLLKDATGADFAAGDILAELKSMRPKK